MMTTDIRKPQPKTLLDLKELNFSLFILDDLGSLKIEFIKGYLDEDET